MESAYHNMYFYHVLDKDIDWTSNLGIARDGICLVDAEIGLGYLFLPY